MGLLLPEISSELSSIAYGVTGVIVAIAILRSRSNLEAFPTAGASGLLGSWGAGIKFLASGADVIREGYEKYKSAPFKVADLCSWIVIVSSPEHIEELRRAPKETLSFAGAISDRLNTSYTLGDEVHDAPYHLAVLRSQLTRNIGTQYPMIRDEIVTAFDEILDLRGNEWKSILVLDVMQNIACRASNRAFVGLPLCRNPDWIDLSIQYSVNVFKTGFTIGLFPVFLRPLVAPFFRAIPRNTLRGLKHISPIIEDRLNHFKDSSREWAAEPNDLISWLIEEAKGPQLTVKALTTRVLVINFATIHTIAVSFAYALFYLAANPQYVQPLREEVETIVENEGWSKEALDKMHKVDSFLRESQRMEGVFVLSLGRKALKDFTFSDGTFIPKGTVISAPAQCLHYDEKLYEDPNVFKPFRFADMEAEEGGKHQFVSPGNDYLPFGHGKSVCPGRFFAASLMKTMLAHTVTMYDVKFEDGVARPRNWHFADFVTPNPFAKVLFRKRVD